MDRMSMFGRYAGVKRLGISLLLHLLYAMSTTVERAEAKDVSCAKQTTARVLTLKCPKGGAITEILSAAYGRPSDPELLGRSCTSPLQSSDMDAESLTALVPESHRHGEDIPITTKEIVENFCIGRSTCTVPVLPSVLAAPKATHDAVLVAVVRCDRAGENARRHDVHTSSHAETFQLLVQIDDVDNSFEFEADEHTPDIDAFEAAARSFLAARNLENDDNVDALVFRMYEHVASSRGNDPIGRLHVESPRNGAVYEDSFVAVGTSLEMYKAKSTNAKARDWTEAMPEYCATRHECSLDMCYELRRDKDNASRRSECVELHRAYWMIDELETGATYVMRAWLQTDEGVRVTAPTTSRFRVHYDDAISGNRRLNTAHAATGAETLTDAQKWPWAVSESDTRPTSLVIGVKSSAAHARQRAAIRETWASKLRENVQLYFIVGEPRDSNARAALEKEREMFDGDVLLGEELEGVVDSYVTVSTKVVAFTAWIARTRPSFTHMLILDDDVYLRLDRLLDLLDAPEMPRRRLYAGQVWAVEQKREIQPIRDPRHKYYMSPERYPMRDLYHYANGPHMLMSADFAQWIAASRHMLRPVARSQLDDVSLGLWALALDIRVRHLDTFVDARSSKTCPGEDFISFAELSDAGIREIYAKDVAGISVCSNFDQARIVHGHVHAYAKTAEDADEIL